MNKGFQENPILRKRSRVSRCDGLNYKICELKDVTGDDVIITYQSHDEENGVHEVTYSTNRSAHPVQSSLPPSLPVVSIEAPDSEKAFSPTKATKPVKLVEPKVGKDICAICKIKYQSDADKDYAELNGRTWLGCSTKACHWWVHATCFGFIDVQEGTFDDCDFKCRKHCKQKMSRKAAGKKK